MLGKQVQDIRLLVEGEGVPVGLLAKEMFLVTGGGRGRGWRGHRREVLGLRNGVD